MKIERPFKVLFKGNGTFSYIVNLPKFFKCLDILDEVRLVTNQSDISLSRMELDNTNSQLNQYCIYLTEEQARECGDIFKKKMSVNVNIDGTQRLNEFACKAFDFSLDDEKEIHVTVSYKFDDEMIFEWWKSNDFKEKIEVK